MSAGHTARRLIEFVKAFIGHIYGGLGVTMAGTCTLFGAISGSTQATVVAIGKTMRPMMLESGYKESNVDGLIISRQHCGFNPAKRNDDYVQRSNGCFRR